MDINTAYGYGISCSGKIQLQTSNDTALQGGQSDDANLAVNAAVEDIVNFSENALKKAQEVSKNPNDEASDGFVQGEQNFDEDKTPFRVKSAETQQAEEAKATSASQESIDAIRKQIKEVKEKLQDADERLQAAQMKLEQARSQSNVNVGGDTPEAAAKRISAEANTQAANSEEGESAAQETPAVDEANYSSIETAIQVSIAQTEVQAVSAEIKSLNGELQVLNKALMEAIKESSGGYGMPGAAQGSSVRASGGGLGFMGIDRGY